MEIGSTATDRLLALFTVGVAIGLSRDQHGAIGLAGSTASLTVTTVLSSEVVATMTSVEETLLAFPKINNAFIGIISDITASVCYSKFGST